VSFRARNLVLPGLGLFALSLVLGAAGPAPAQDATPIDLELRVIYARKEKGVVDPDCRDIQKRLPMSFGSLQIVQSESFRLEPGHPAQFELPTGRAVRLLPVSIVGSRLHVYFEMSGVMNTRLQMVSGRPVIVGGEKHEGGHLILELTPTFRALAGPAAPAPRSPKSPVVRQVNGGTADSR